MKLIERDYLNRLIDVIENHLGDLLDFARVLLNKKFSNFNYCNYNN